MRLLILLIIILGNILLNVYAFYAVKKSLGKSPISRIIRALIVVCFVSIVAAIGIGCYKIYSGAYGLSVFLEMAIIGIMITVIPYSILFVTTLPLDILYIIKRRAYRKARLLLLSVSALTMGYLIVWLAVPMTSYEVVEQEIEIANLPDSFDGFKIVQLSDIHIASLNDAEYRALDEKMTAIVNSLDPDIVAMTGDLIHSESSELDGRSGFLSKIKSRMGNYFVYGNHDIGMFRNTKDKDIIKKDILNLWDIVENNGFEVLKDRVEPLVINQDTVYLMGVGEIHGLSYLKKYEEVIAQIPNDGIIVSLIHNPDYYSRLEDNGYRLADLSLGGHTHAMQMEFGFCGLDWSPSDIMHKYSRGLYVENNKYIYVNRGIGYHAYRRIGMRPEITLLTLRKQKQ